MGAVGGAENDDRMVIFSPDNGSVTTLSNDDGVLKVLELGRAARRTRGGGGRKGARLTRHKRTARARGGRTQGLDQFPELKMLSLCNLGISSLEGFPKLVHLRQLIMSDNPIAGGLEHLALAWRQPARRK